MPASSSFRVAYMVRDRPLQPGKPVLRARIHVGQQTCVAATTLRESPAPNSKSELTSGNPNAFVFRASGVAKNALSRHKIFRFAAHSPAGRPRRCTGLNNPQGVAAEASANDYIADTGNKRVLLATLSRRKPTPRPRWAAGSCLPAPWRWMEAAISTSPTPAIARVRPRSTPQNSSHHIVRHLSNYMVN